MSAVADRPKPAAEEAVGDRDGPVASLDSMRAQATIKVVPGTPQEHLFRRLLGAYLGGAREFVIEERPTLYRPTHDTVREFCRRTRQPEIVSEEPDAVHLRDLAWDGPVPLERRVRRMGRMVVDFHREAVESWSALPLDHDGHWQRRDDEIDREAWFLERTAALSGYREAGDTFSPAYWTIARSLERIADHAATLGELGPRLVELGSGGGSISTLRQFHAQAMTHLEGALAGPDPSAANDLLDTGEALIISGRTLADRLLPAVGGGALPPASAAAVARAFDSIGRTVAYTQDIVQITLDRPVVASVSRAEGVRERELYAPTR